MTNDDPRIRRATAADADVIGALVFELLEELTAPERSGYQVAAVSRIARDLLQPGDRAWAFVAEQKGEPVAVLTLSECVSIYAGGRFGEICELYVRPALRASGLGKRLIDAAVVFARQRGWTRLEVGAPEVPRWQRSVDFYRQSGFSVVGPRLKLELRAEPPRP